METKTQQPDYDEEQIETKPIPVSLETDAIIIRSSN